MAKNRQIGMWLYQNSGGDKIQEKLISKLKERDIDTLANINLREAIAKNGHIIHNKVKLDKLDYFSLIMQVNKLNTKCICIKH